MLTLCVTCAARGAASPPAITMLQANRFIAIPPIRRARGSPVWDHRRAECKATTLSLRRIVRASPPPRSGAPVDASGLRAVVQAPRRTTAEDDRVAVDADVVAAL